MLLLNFYQRGHTQYPPPCAPKGVHRPVYSILRRRRMSSVAHTDLQILF